MDTPNRRFSEGMEALRNFRIPQARPLFEDALAIDPEFALAQFRLASIAESRADRANGFAMAARNLDRLPQRERVMVRARQTVSDGDVESAVDMLTTHVSRYPDHEEAYVRLAELHRVELSQPQQAALTLGAVTVSNSSSRCHGELHEPPAV